jgi:medium-chain acyl-[acyl-carrier-protein] hydrolase
MHFSESAASASQAVDAGGPALQASRRAIDRSPWLISQPKPFAGIRLFCFPFAGGNPAYFHPWSAKLGEDVEVCALVQPGKAYRIREQPYRRLLDLVDELIPATLPYLDRPTVFFGHSMGAWIAYELTRRLSIKPEHLVISAASPVPGPLRGKVHLMDDDMLVAELQLLGGTPREILEDREFFSRFFPIIRADFEMLETHLESPSQPLEVPVTLWSGARDPRVSPAHIQGWADKFVASARHKTFSGGHMFIGPDQNEVACLEELKKIIAEIAETV